MAIKSDGSLRCVRPRTSGTANDFKREAAEAPNRQTRKETSRRRFVLYNIPVVREEDGKDGPQNPDPKQKWRRLATDVEKCYVGPMPVDEFIETFLPVGLVCDDAMPPVKDAFKAFSTPGKTEKETDIGQSLVSNPSDGATWH